MLNLATNTPNGQARTAALAITASAETVPAGIVPYASAGSLLIIGEEAQALAAAKQCQQQENISCTVLVAEPGMTTVGRREQGGFTTGIVRRGTSTALLNKHLPPSCGSPIPSMVMPLVKRDLWVTAQRYLRRNRASFFQEFACST